MIDGLVIVPRDALAKLFQLYTTYWGIDGDVGRNIQELDDVCLAIEPYEDRLAKLLAEGESHGKRLNQALTAPVHRG